MKEYRNKGFQDVISTANELADELDVPEENRKFSTKRTRRKKSFCVKGEMKQLMILNRHLKLNVFTLFLIRE